MTTTAARKVRHYYAVEVRTSYGWATYRSYFTEKAACRMSAALVNASAPGTVRIMRDGQIWATS